MGIIQKIGDKLSGSNTDNTNVDNTSNVHPSSTHPTAGSSNPHDHTTSSTTNHGTSGATSGTHLGEGSHLASHNQKYDGLSSSHAGQSSTTSALPHGSHSTSSNTTHLPGQHSSATSALPHGSHRTSATNSNTHIPGASSTTSGLPHGSHSGSATNSFHIPGTSSTGRDGSILPGHNSGSTTHQSGSVLPNTHSNNATSHLPGQTSSTTSHVPGAFPSNDHGHDSTLTGHDSGHTTQHNSSILPNQHHSSNTTHLPGQSSSATSNIPGPTSTGLHESAVPGSNVHGTSAGHTGLTGSHNTNTASGLHNEGRIAHGAGSHPTGTTGHSHDNTTTSTHNSHSDKSAGGVSGLLNKIPGIGHKDHDKHAHNNAHQTHDQTSGVIPGQSAVGGHHAASGPEHHNLSSTTAHNTALNSGSDHHSGPDHRKSSIKPVSGPHASLENHNAIPTAGGVKVGDGPFEQDRSYDPTAKTNHITSGVPSETHGHGHTAPDNRGITDKAKDTLSSKRTNHPDDPITGTNFDQKNSGHGQTQHSGVGNSSLAQSHGGLTGSSHTQSGHGGLGFSNVHSTSVNDHTRTGLFSDTYGQTQHSGLGSSNVHQGGINDYSHAGLSSNTHQSGLNNSSHSGLSSGTHIQSQHSGLGSSNVHQGGINDHSHAGLSSNTHQSGLNNPSHGQSQHVGFGSTGSNLTSGTSASQPLSHDQSFADRHIPGAGNTSTSGHNTSTGNPLTHNTSSNVPGTQTHSGLGGVGHSSTGNPLSSNTHNNASGGGYQTNYSEDIARQQAEQSRR